MSIYGQLQRMSGSEFGVDDEAFEELVAVGRQADRRFHRFLVGVVVLNVVLILALHVIVFPGLLVLSLVHSALHRQANRMARALNINRTSVARAARAMRRAV